MLDAENRQRVFARLEILLWQKTPGRRQPRDIVGFLHGQGDAEQRPGLAPRERRVGVAGGLEAALKIAHANRIDLAVVTLDAADRILRQLDGRHFLCRKRCRQRGRGLETPLRFGQGVCPGLVRMLDR